MTDPFEGYANPWEYHIAGNPPADEGEEIPTVANSGVQQFTYVFPGLAAVTPDGGGAAFPAVGSAGGKFRLIRFAVAGVSGFLGDADTVLRVSNAPAGGGGAAAQVTLPGGESTALTTAGFEFAGDATLYLICSQAGGHADVCVLVQYEPA